MTVAPVDPTKVQDEIAADFKTAIQSMVNPKLVAFKAEHPEIRLQRQARIAAEANIGIQTGWRNELDLPPGVQLVAHQQPVHANHNVFFMLHPLKQML